jgi:hypothetical protein
MKKQIRRSNWSGLVLQKKKKKLVWTCSGLAVQEHLQYCTSRNLILVDTVRTKDTHPLARTGVHGSSRSQRVSVKAAANLAIKAVTLPAGGPKRASFLPVACDLAPALLTLCFRHT